MVDLVREENRRLRAELQSLQQVIIRVEPAVLLDGRFEAMISHPISIIQIARELLERLAEEPTGPT